MSNSKVRISNPQALNGEWFYVDGILYTITDFRWDGGHDSGEFKGYLTVNIPHPNQIIKVEIFFFLDTTTNILKLNTDVDPNHYMIMDLAPDSLKNKRVFIHTALETAVTKMIESDSAFAKIIKSSPDYHGNILL